MPCKRRRRSFPFTLSSLKPFFFRWFNADKVYRVRLLMERLEERVTPVTTDFWNGVGNWTDTSHWSMGVVPLAQTPAVIQSGTVTHSSGTDSAGSITISSGAELDVTGGQLNANNSFANNGKVNASGFGTLFLPAGVYTGTFLHSGNGQYSFTGQTSYSTGTTEFASNVMIGNAVVSTGRR